MFVNSVLTKEYEDKSNWTLGENKPNFTILPWKRNFLTIQEDCGKIIDVVRR
jgi:hypothetical protein